jgi:hypothetical protein
MYETFEQLQSEYIAALRALAPEILAWWSANCPYSWTEPVPYEAMSDFHRRWAVGPAAHPRIIALFRQYFIAADELNDRFAEERGGEEDDDVEVWGQDVHPEPIKAARPIDLLVNDLANIAPDLHEIMQGMLFVPVGMDPDGEVS